jgi:hypothetical protein
MHPPTLDIGRGPSNTNAQASSSSNDNPEHAASTRMEAGESSRSIPNNEIPGPSTVGSTRRISEVEDGSDEEGRVPRRRRLE